MLCSFIRQWKEGKQWWGQLCGRSALFMASGSSLCDIHYPPPPSGFENYKWFPPEVDLEQARKEAEDGRTGTD